MQQRAGADHKVNFAEIDGTGPKAGWTFDSTATWDWEVVSIEALRDKCQVNDFIGSSRSLGRGAKNGSSPEAAGIHPSTREPPPN